MQLEPTAPYNQSLMPTIPFTKVQGAGNDFVLVDGRTRDLDWSALAAEICTRHFGVGSDGLLILQESNAAPVRMVMYNPDGSLSEMCGNGLRCFVKYAVERGGIPASDGGLAVDTGAGILHASFDATAARIDRVRLSMGAPGLSPQAVPVVAESAGPVIGLPLDVDGETYDVTCASMGNPHAVHFSETPVDEIPLDRIGPLVEHDNHFPNRTNFEIVNVLAPDRLRARVWERGVGLTLACGTGACAVLVAARLNGLADQQATVCLPGGDLELEWDGDPASPVYLEGPAAYVFDGEWILNGHA